MVRHNADLEAAYAKLCEIEFGPGIARRRTPGDWTNQNVVFIRALLGHVSVGKDDCRRRLMRDECRGTHFKPEFAMPDIDATDPAERRRQAEAWCDRSRRTIASG